MSKISYVSGNLHRISGQLSEATAKKIPPQEEETAEAGAARSDKMVPASPREEVKPDYAELHKHLKHRFDELLRLKRDVNARIEEHHAFYSAEAEALHHRVMELEETVDSGNPRFCRPGFQIQTDKCPENFRKRPSGRHQNRGESRGRPAFRPKCKPFRRRQRGWIIHQTDSGGSLQKGLSLLPASDSYASSLHTPACRGIFRGMENRILSGSHGP